jgi:hypothetical protein
MQAGENRHDQDCLTLKMVSLMISEWIYATPLTALLPTTARYAMFTSLHISSICLATVPTDVKLEDTRAPQSSLILINQPGLLAYCSGDW